MDASDGIHFFVFYRYVLAAANFYNKRRLKRNPSTKKPIPVRLATRAAVVFLAAAFMRESVRAKTKIVRETMSVNNSVMKIAVSPVMPSFPAAIKRPTIKPEKNPTKARTTNENGGTTIMRPIIAKTSDV